MIGLSLFRHRGIVPRVLPALALALGGLLAQPVPSGAADQPADPSANPNVIVDDSVLDSLSGGATSGEGPLPAPAQPPISRVLQPGESAVSSQTPPTVAPDTTVGAAPTTPIGSTELSPATGGAPANGTAAEGTPAEGNAAAPLNGGENQAAAPASAAPTDAKASDAKGSEAEQVAAKPPIEGMVRVPYDGESAAISDAAKTEIAPLVEKLNADYSLRVQVLAYASGDEQASTHARGVSLARALAMRGYLVEQGIAVNRMDLRALGNTAQEQPPDRVDLIPFAQ